MMIRLLINCIVMRFSSTPQHAFDRLLQVEMLLQSRGDRHALDILSPGFPHDDPPVEPPQKPGRPIPTDVPMPEPMDVPAPDPKDVPVPDPGTVPTPAKPMRTKNDPKPRSVP